MFTVVLFKSRAGRGCTHTAVKCAKCKVFDMSRIETSHHPPYFYLQVHKIIWLENIWLAVDRVRLSRSTNMLTLDLIQKIQVMTVKVVAQYSVEVW